MSTLPPDGESAEVYAARLRARDETPSVLGMVEALEKGGAAYEAKVTETARTLLVYEYRMGRTPEPDWDKVTDRTRRAYRDSAERAMLASGAL
jgi:hypothetical protein